MPKQHAAAFCLRARWVFPLAGPPLPNAAVTIAGGRIVSVGSPPGDLPIEDLGSAAIIPGLVNAHTHLEFSDLPSPIGERGMGLVEWLGAVVRHRAAVQTTSSSRLEQGLRESLQNGATTIGEIAQAGGGESAYRESPCDGTLFLELIAPRIDRVPAALEAAAKHVDPIGQWQAGLSPHAPYTVHPRLLAQAVEHAALHRIPLAMHIAESREEIEWLRTGGGPIRELLESRNAWDPTARPLGGRPLNDLRILAAAHRALVIHGNYLDDEEIEFLGQHRRNMAVIYCPRTHTWFDHARYPLEKMLAAGAVLALGTDSRASTPDLSLLNEMRHIAAAYPAMSRATILELGTLAGARAMGREAEIGSLEPGKWANLAAVQLPEDSPKEFSADPHELLLDAAGPMVATWVRGERCPSP